MAPAGHYEVQFPFIQGVSKLLFGYLVLNSVGTTWKWKLDIQLMQLSCVQFVQRARYLRHEAWCSQFFIEFLALNGVNVTS